MKYQSLLLKRALPVFVLSAVMLASFSIVYSQSASPREEKLLNGLKLLMFDAPSADKVTLKVRIHAGSAFDPQGKEGLMKLLAANVFPNPEAKEYFADQLGGSLDVTTNYDYIQINATSRPDKLISMIETVAAAIVNMENDKETTAKLKASQLQKVNELATDPSYVADQAASARLLGAFHMAVRATAPLSLSGISTLPICSQRNKDFSPLTMRQLQFRASLTKRKHSGPSGDISEHGSRLIN